MIKITLRGQDPAEIRHQAAHIFGLVEPAGVIAAPVPASAADVPSVEPTKRARKKAEPAPEPEKTLAQEKREQAEAAGKGDKPEFLEDEKPVAGEAPEVVVDEKQAEKWLEDLRSAADQALKSGVKMTDVSKVITSFKAADGSPAKKMSQVLPADLPNCIALITALTTGK